MLFVLVRADPLGEIVLRVLSHGWESTGVWYSSCLADRSWYGECPVESFDGSLNLISGDDSFDDTPLLDDRAEWKVVLTVSSIE